MPAIQIINPIEYPGWDDLLLSTPGYSFFHSSAWARVLSESYSYTPKYFTVTDDHKFLALVPLMEVDSFLTGRRGVSLPFTDYCRPIITNGIPFPTLFEHVIENGKERGWKSLELRSSSDLLPSTLPSLTYLGHVLNLSQNEGQIFANFRDSTKRNVKKAMKEGVKVKIDSSLDSVEAFYRLNCITRREHGLPPQPLNFFKRIHDHVISKNLGMVVLASFDRENIAGAVYFHFGEKAVYKYGASDKKFQHLRANNLVMLEAIRWYSQNGYKSLCFGRTEPENQGLLQFKSGWGTTEQQINYYKYDLKKNSFVPSSSKASGFHNKVFRKMPIPVLNSIGNILYRHVG